MTVSQVWSRSMIVVVYATQRLHGLLLVTSIHPVRITKMHNECCLRCVRLGCVDMELRRSMTRRSQIDRLTSYVVVLRRDTVRHRYSARCVVHLHSIRGHIRRMPMTHTWMLPMVFRMLIL